MCLVLWRSGSESRGISSHLGLLCSREHPRGFWVGAGSRMGLQRGRNGDFSWCETQLWCLMCQWGPKHGCAGGSGREHVLNGMSSRALLKYAMRSHAKPCCAKCTVPCHATWAGDTLMEPRLASRLGRGSQPGSGILPALLAEAWHHCLEGNVAAVPGSQGEAQNLSAHSQDPWATRRYGCAGLCVKGFTALIINTINRFVVLL